MEGATISEDALESIPTPPRAPPPPPMRAVSQGLNAPEKGERKWAEEEEDQAAKGEEWQLEDVEEGKERDSLDKGALLFCCVDKGD